MPVNGSDYSIDCDNDDISVLFVKQSSSVDNCKIFFVFGKLLMKPLFEQCCLDENWELCFCQKRSCLCMFVLPAFIWMVIFIFWVVWKCQHVVYASLWSCPHSCFADVVKIALHSAVLLSVVYLLVAVLRCVINASSSTFEQPTFCSTNSVSVYPFRTLYQLLNFDIYCQLLLAALWYVWIT